MSDGSTVDLLRSFDVVGETGVGPVVASEVPSSVDDDVEISAAVASPGPSAPSPQADTTSITSTPHTTNGFVTVRTVPTTST